MKTTYTYPTMLLQDNQKDITFLLGLTGFSVLNPVSPPLQNITSLNFIMLFNSFSLFLKVQAMSTCKTVHAKQYDQ